jgi:hypothetical protein
LTAKWYTYFMAIWYILWSFGIFFPFWYVVPRKIWQPCFPLRFSSEKLISVVRRINFFPKTVHLEIHRVDKFVALFSGPHYVHLTLIRGR